MKVKELETPRNGFFRMDSDGHEKFACAHKTIQLQREGNLHRYRLQGSSPREQRHLESGLLGLGSGLGLLLGLELGLRKSSVKFEKNNRA